MQGKRSQIRSVRNHVAIIIIFETAHIIDIDFGSPAVMKQFFFVFHPVLREQCDRIVRTDRFFVDRHFLGNQFPHSGFHFIKKILIQCHITVDRTVISAADGKMDPNSADVFMPCLMVECLQQKQRHTPPVGRHPFLLPCCDKRNAAVLR